jgi:hypothetical protein
LPPALKAVGEPFALAPNTVLFQVMLPTTILDANGQPGITTAGPFLDIQQATAYANARPGSLLAVLTIVYQAPPATAAPAAKA